jgi:hypothetical protein
VDSAVDSAVYSAVDSAVRSAVDAAVRSAVDAAVCSAVGSLGRSFAWGQFNAGYSSWTSFFVQECELQLPGRGNAIECAYSDANRSACLWWPFKDFVMVCERPSKIRRDESGRLHCADGMALEWPGGWGLWMWHGQAVPKEWILEPTKIDPVAALKWQNVEQRRAACEIVGWKRILEVLNPTVVDEDVDPEIGTLLRADLPDSPGEQFLKVRCGTGRDFVLIVPPDVTTALEANAWTYDIKPTDLRKLEART